MYDFDKMTNPQLVKLHSDLKKMLRSEQVKLLNKKDYLQSKITQMRFEKANQKDISSKDSRVLFAGNVNDINSIFWPFFFSTRVIEVGPNSNEIANITITQEAAFTCVAMQKVVFVDNGGTIEYLDPRAYDNNVLDGNANGLKFSIVDSQSGRSWFESPVSIDHIGDGKEPYTLPSPVLSLPNSNNEIQFFNNSTNTYYVGFMFIGYRVRIEDAQNILSLVTE